MGLTITTKLLRDKKKCWHYFEWGKEADQRKSTGIFTYVQPNGQTQKNLQQGSTGYSSSQKIPIYSGATIGWDGTHSDPQVQT